MQKQYTVAIRTELGTYAPVMGLPLMTLEQAQKAANIGRDAGHDAVAFNINAQ